MAQPLNPAQKRWLDDLSMEIKESGVPCKAMSQSFAVLRDGKGNEAAALVLCSFEPCPHGLKDVHMRHLAKNPFGEMDWWDESCNGMLKIYPDGEWEIPFMNQGGTWYGSRGASVMFH